MQQRTCPLVAYSFFILTIYPEKDENLPFYYYRYYPGYLCFQ
jgi:hypothetical protein